MAETKPQFANFKEAFCAYYRVRPEKFANTVLWRSLPWSRRLLAVPILTFNRTFFATDLDIIRNLESIQSAEEFSLQLDELYAVNRIERSIRRGFLGIRASGSRLMNLWKTVEPYVTPPVALSPMPRVAARAPASSPFLAGSARTSPAIARRVGRMTSAPAEVSGETVARVGLGVVDAIETSPEMLDRLQRAFENTVRGIPLEEAVSTTGLDSVAHFRRLLEVNAAANPGFRWLHEQLQQGEMRREMEGKIVALKKKLEEQTVELARLRGNHRR